MKGQHLTPERLGRYVEGLLSEELDREADLHLRHCEACASFADGYARLLLELEGAAVDESKLEAAAARLDVRMRPYLSPASLPWHSRARELLRSLLPGLELVPLVGEGLRELARARSGLPLVTLNGACEAEASEMSAIGELKLEAPVLRADGSRGRTTVLLDEVPRWPSPSLQLLLEFDLEYANWEVVVAYLLREDAAAAEPVAVTLYEGLVDEEGLVDLKTRWPEMAPNRFDPADLRVCLVDPTGREDRL